MSRPACFAAAVALASTLASAEPEVARCGPDQGSWRPSDFTSTPDLSFLNHKPAGRHGFLRARGDAFEFSDGTRARFWGTNVVADAIFGSSDAAIDSEAKRLAQLGFNLVRLHHHDSGGWVNPNVIAPAGDALLDSVAMGKLDRWIAALKAQGVYVWLDIHTGRVFRPEQEIPGFAEMQRGRKPPSAKGFLYVSSRLEQLTVELAEAFLGHRNELTGLSYRDDPAVAALLVTNENDLSHHFGNLFAADKNTPLHRERFLAAAREFASRTGLPIRSVERTWEPGPAKLFLADLERNVATRVRSKLRASGVRAPIAFTSYWGSSSTSALAALSQGDFVDVHSYAQGSVLRTDPRRELGLLGWIAAGHLAGMPLTVSEWNHGEPLQRERYEAHLWLASIAAFQDWDAPILFAHAQKPFERPVARRWNAALDPAIAPLMPAAALLYRRDVAAARKRVVLLPSEALVFAERGAPQRFAGLSSTLERHRVSIALPETKALPWLKLLAVAGDERVTDVTKPRLAADATRVQSDTGEILRDFAAGWARGDTPRAQWAAGALSVGAIALSAVRIESKTDAAVAFSSLDGAPLASSKQILVSIAARACSTTKRDPLWRSQPIDGRAWLNVKGERQLRPLDPAGETRRLAREERGLAVPLDFRGGWAVIEPAR